MKFKQRIISLAFLLLVAVGALAQEPPEYNPFISANLDDPVKLDTNYTVVAGSYHKYWIQGDQNYDPARPSTFVWYVENGNTGSYDPITHNWVAFAEQTVGDGEYISFTGETITINGQSVSNSSEVWIKWDDDKGGTIGYVAVYEISADGCIREHQIDGFKHRILLPPEMWFEDPLQEECAVIDSITIGIHLNRLDELSFPYVLTFEYPKPPDVYNPTTRVDTIEADDMNLYPNVLDYTSEFIYYVEIEGIPDYNPGVDESYNITLKTLEDKFGALGIIPSDKSGVLELKILHLPETQDMQME